MGEIKLNIEECNTFEEVAANKQHAFEVNSASQLNIDGILADLYTDPTHFIFELIQNAEDARASEVSITLQSHRLIFQHDGRPFDLRDLKGITSVNYSPKADDYTKIGRFGIGFKAVFGICDEPEIYSGEYSFKIRNFYVPEKISSRKVDGTEIILNFKTGEQEEIYSKIEETLVAMRPETLLFLRHIHQIDYLTNTKCGFYKREKIAKQIGTREYFECSIKTGGGILSKYLVFEAPIDRTDFSAELIHGTDQLYVSVAYRVDPESGKIISEGESTKLVVYFPTERDTYLQFKINGPFRTTPTRENIPFTPENIAILDTIVALYQESILAIKDLGALTIAFCEMLPLNPKRFDSAHPDRIYYKFQSATERIFSEDQLLPAHDGGFTDASSAVLARGQITDLLSAKDLEMLFDGRNHWLSTEITEKYRNLYFFLKNTLEVEEVDFDAFMVASSRDFFLKKSDTWFIKFYRKAYSNLQTMLNKHLTKKFIKTESGDIVAPFISTLGKKQKNVYLPSELITDESRIVRRDLIKNAEVLRFLSQIGIERMDIVESIRTQWIPSLHNCSKEEKYVAQFLDLYREYIEQKPQKREELIGLLRSSAIIYHADGFGNIYYREPNKFFMPNSPAEILYGDCKDAFFLSPLLADSVKKEKGLSAFLKELGVQTGLVPIEKKDSLLYNEMKAIMQGARYAWHSDTDYELKYINYLLEHMTQNISLELMRQLNALPSKFFKGELRWGYYNDRQKREFDAAFVKTLQNSKWLYDRQGELVSPSEICEEEVKEIYGNGPALRYFTFKPDIVKSLPENMQAILEITKGCSPEDVKLALQLWNAQQSHVSRAIDFDAAEAPTEIEDATFSDPLENMSAEELIESDSGEPTAGPGEADATLFDKETTSMAITQHVAVKQTSNEAQVIGEWGEKTVLEALKKGFRDKGFGIYNVAEDGFSAKSNEKIYDVKRQNSAVRTQKGYDIAIFERDNIVQYIEVKTKKSDEKEYFAVSGLQWEFAKKLHREGNGYKYFVYVVTRIQDANTRRITRFSDPYAAWLEGSLEADPVRIKY